MPPWTPSTGPPGPPSDAVATGPPGQCASPSNAPRRYHWTCAPASTPRRPCLAGPAAHSLDTAAPALSFTADSLSGSYDQFLVTLTVSSRGRNSSEAQVFLSALPDAALRCHLPCRPHGARLGVVLGAPCLLGLGATKETGCTHRTGS